MGDLEVVKDMLFGKELASMSLGEIASVIKKDWKKVNFGAVPYLDAMGAIDSNGMFLADPWQSIVAYFLGNANTWRGPVAKEVKAELKKRLKKNKMARLQKVASSLREVGLKTAGFVSFKGEKYEDKAPDTEEYRGKWYYRDDELIEDEDDIGYWYVTQDGGPGPFWSLIEGGFVK